PLDREALRRGNSVYLPGMVVPMLPEVLSNDICSLRPDRRRLAHSVFIDFDRTGKMLKWELADTIIKSRAKLSYEEVQEYFDNGNGTIQTDDVGENLTIARELAKLLTQKRFAAGSLDFDLSESKVTLNEKGEVLELSSRIRLESHRLIEEFMLAANKAVALEASRQRRHFLYRVHDRPDEEKITEFSEIMKRLGYSFPVSDNLRPIQFSRFLEKVKDAPEADFINELMLRSMKKAVYQRDNIGHFGLAFTHYAHFTSPIRRYPDLLVHRLLRLMAQGGYTGKIAENAAALIDRIGRHCSDTERVAEAAEREGIKVKQVQFMARHVGDEFEGVISGVARWGFWVRLDKLGAEGLVRISSIDDDYYHFDEKHYRLIGRRRKRTFRMGDH
ncbi:MAG: ribonuclease R family protein, partial [Candidatus Zixiibacteriota bacterium]